MEEGITNRIAELESYAKQLTVELRATDPYIELQRVNAVVAELKNLLQPQTPEQPPQP